MPVFSCLVSNNHTVHFRFNLSAQSSPEAKYVLVGNKSDLTSERVVTEEEAQQLADTLGFEYYIETSAKDDVNIDRAIQLLYRAAIKQ